MSERSTNFRSYFQVGLKSFQGRITLGFLVTILVFCLFLFFTNWYWSSYETRKDVLLTQAKPLALELAELDRLLTQSQKNLVLYAYLGNDSLMVRIKQSWLINIPETKSKIKNVVNQLDVPDLDVQYSNLNALLGRYKQEEEKFIRILRTTTNPQIRKHELRSELFFIFNEVSRQIAQLEQLVTTYEREIYAELSSTRILYARGVIIGIILAFLLSYFVGIRLFQKVFEWIREISTRLGRLSDGYLVDTLEPQAQEYSSIVNYTNNLNDNLKSVRDFAIEVGKGNFGQQRNFFSQDSDLGKAFTEMEISLQRVNEEEKNRNWITQGLAEFSELLSAYGQETAQVAQNIIGRLMKRLDAIQGGFFVLRQNADQPGFELIASYAYGKEKFQEKWVGIDDGLVGRVFHERELVYLEDIPEGYMEIASGVGQAEPKTLILVPLLNDETELVGIIEMASLYPFEPHQIEFLTKLGGNIAYSIKMMETDRKNISSLDSSNKTSLSKV